jgi:hypothetical protein
LEIHQPQSQTIGSNTNHHNNQLIEIIGGNVIIGPEYTKLQQIMMLDYFYTCTITITILISFVYYGILHYIVFLRQRSRWQNHASPMHHFHHMNGSTDGPMEFDDVHNFDYMNDLHIDDDDDNELYDDPKGDHSTSDWIPLSENDSNSDSNHDTAETSTFPTNDSQHYSNDIEFHQGDDDTDMFFDTTPFLMENDNLLSYDNDNNINSIRICDGNLLPNEVCVIAKGDEMTTPTVLVNGPTMMMPSRYDAMPPSQFHREALQHPQQIQFQQLDNVHNDATDSSGALPIDGTQPILLPPSTRIMDDHRTIAGDTKYTSIGTDSKSDTKIQKMETPPPEDTVLEEPISGNDEGQTCSSSGSIIITSLKSSPVATTTITPVHVPISPPPLPSSVSTDDHKNPPPANHQNNKSHRNLTTMDTDEISMIRLLWNELQDRDRSSNKIATASSATDDHLDYSEYTNKNSDDDNEARGHDDITTRDGLYQEYPFLAIFLS